MLWDEITWFYTVAEWVMIITFLYCIFAVVYLLFRLVTYPFSRWKITVKRMILFPREILFKHREEFYYASKKVNTAIVLLLSVLMILEGIRWSGFNTNIGSYTEYPNNVSGYYVMVYGTGSKYYKLPAVIRRQSLDNGQYVHCIEKAFWPNGGTITFSADEYSSVVLNETTTALFVDDNEEYSEIEVMLTNEKSSDSRISKTTPRFNISVFTSALSVFVLLLYFAPIQFPGHDLDDDKDQRKAEPLKPVPCTKSNVFCDDTVINSSLPPVRDYGKWFSTLFLEAEQRTKDNMTDHTLREECALLVSFFDTALFSILLLTENHDFEAYCFNRLKSALAENKKTEFYQYFVKHYNFIIDIFNQSLREHPENKELCLNAVIESSVDYFYKHGDSLEHSYVVHDALLESTLSISVEFSEFYKKK